jgi:thiamine pyrophosphokinase
MTVAVDGGIRFFLKNRIRPDILLGDFDSAPRLTKKYLAPIEIVRHPQEKDKTDSHLAVDLALSRGAKTIEIFGGTSADEIDHALGNIFLLEIINRWKKAKNTHIAARLLSPKTEVYLLHDDKISLNGNTGDFLSILPLSDKTSINFSGLKYPPPRVRLSLGNSLPLRNEFSAKTCRIAIGGKAVIVHSRQGTPRLTK